MGKGDIKHDTIFVMFDDDFIALSQGKLNPQSAFMTVSILHYLIKNALG